MTKQAMVNLYKNGILPHIQIHDELCVSIPDEETALKIKNIMENAIRLKIPNKVDYASGKNWGSIKQEETMDMIKDAIKDLWANHRKKVIGAGVVIVILIIAALQDFMINGVPECKYTIDLLSDQERISL